jgi:thiamine kinase-like enzyme
MNTIIKRFKITGDIVSIKPYGNGHINDTYLVELENPNSKYILQRVNHHIFKHVNELIDNIYQVTTFIENEYERLGIINQNVQKLVPTHLDSFYVIHEDSYYRMYEFVHDTITYQQIPDAETLYKAGRGFGQFQSLLNHFDAKKLYEIIPNFHHTPTRLLTLKEAIHNTSKERYQKAKAMINLALEKSNYANLITDAIEKNEIPIRVTHNDTKLNNILFDERTNDVRCIVDLDTVMPGSALYDYGDAIRFACNKANEDEKDISLIKLNQDYFEAFSKGFIEELKNQLTDKEYELLPFGAIIMTYEVGIRFLTDYLNHDIYFKTHYEDHNLVRAINQLTFSLELENHLDYMKDVIMKFRGKS